MECPKCLSDNPDTRKFCYECGAKLLKICSQCGSENPGFYMSSEKLLPTKR
ncbi:MAG: double zinc ribbon domain-containing protein [Planctomycetota bacterium]